MTLASFDPFTRIVPSGPATFSGFYALTIYDPGCWLGLAALGQTRDFHQLTVHIIQQGTHSRAGPAVFSDAAILFCLTIRVLFKPPLQTHSVPVVAAKAGLRQATGYRPQGDPVLPCHKKARRGRRRADPLSDIFDTEVLPLLTSAPGLRPVAIFEELLRCIPDPSRGIRRTQVRRIRIRALNTVLNAPARAHRDCLIGAPIPPSTGNKSEPRTRLAAIACNRLSARIRPAALLHFRFEHLAGELSTPPGGIDYDQTNGSLANTTEESTRRTRGA